MLNEREEMDNAAAYGEVGTFRRGAEMCGTCHKTVRRVLERQGAKAAGGERPARRRNYEDVRDVVVKRVASTRGRITASGHCRRPERRVTRGRPGTSGGS